MQLKDSQNAAKIQSKCNQNAFKMQSKRRQNSVKMQSKCSQNAVKMNSKHSQNSVQNLLGVHWKVFSKFSVLVSNVEKFYFFKAFIFIENIPLCTKVVILGNERVSRKEDDSFMVCHGLKCQFIQSDPTQKMKASKVAHT